MRKNIAIISILSILSISCKKKECFQCSTYTAYISKVDSVAIGNRIDSSNESDYSVCGTESALDYEHSHTSVDTEYIRGKESMVSHVTKCH